MTVMCRIAGPARAVCGRLSGAAVGRRVCVRDRVMTRTRGRRSTSRASDGCRLIRRPTSTMTTKPPDDRTNPRLRHPDSDPDARPGSDRRTRPRRRPTADSPQDSRRRSLRPQPDDPPQNPDEEQDNPFPWWILLVLAAASRLARAYVLRGPEHTAARKKTEKDKVFVYGAAAAQASRLRQLPSKGGGDAAHLRQARGRGALLSKADHAAVAHSVAEQLQPPAPGRRANQKGQGNLPCDLQGNKAAAQTAVPCRPCCSPAASTTRSIPRCGMRNPRPCTVGTGANRQEKAGCNLRKTHPRGQAPVNAQQAARKPGGKKKR